MEDQDESLTRSSERADVDVETNAVGGRRAKRRRRSAVHGDRVSGARGGFFTLLS